MQSFLPRMVIQIDYPQIADDMTFRDHNKFTKESLKEAVVEKSRRDWPKHFRTGNKSRYNHKPRSRIYLKRKRRETGQQVDLVYSGRSRNQMKNVYQVRASGTAMAGNVSAQISHRWPFAQRPSRLFVAARGGRRRAVKRNPQSAETVAQITMELSTWAADEVEPAKKDFEDRYAQRLATKRSTRKRVRYRLNK